MKDITGKEVKVGDKVRFYHDQHAGVVVGFEQVGTIHENIRVENREIGYYPAGSYKRIANVWPYQIRVNN